MQLVTGDLSSGVDEDVAAQIAHVKPGHAAANCRGHHDRPGGRDVGGCARGGPRAPMARGTCPVPARAGARRLPTPHHKPPTHTQHANTREGRGRGEPLIGVVGGKRGRAGGLWGASDVAFWLPPAIGSQLTLTKPHVHR